MPTEITGPEFGPLLYALLIATSFIGSAVTAAFSIGGGLLLIAVMGAIMPATALVPVHGLVMMGSNAGRAFVFRRGIDRFTLGAFFGGAVIGALIGGQMVVTLPEAALRLLIGGFIIYSQWGPPLKLPFGRKSFAVAGAVSTFLTLFVGASGPFMTALIAQVPHFNRINVVGSAAACMTIQHGLKVLVFGFAGFAFGPWLPLIALSIGAGFLGTLTGAQLLSRLNEATFRRALKWLLTALAAYMILMAVLRIV